ncbi:helix-turn-helix transcriptional regulator [Nitrosomonas marina]|uniref:Transcriptional regulator, AlpA family n=1 Tax=Nitrosomonas marina TaxID=917 RepID=A0A1H8FEV7_9PROT|nr:AlpA family transcriptional regulator [Nitrosomonas marina]SEN30411.1 transcriptional regulator, AlpA family [Nitrosomonas marina]
MSANEAKLIRIKDVIAISGLKRSTLYANISKGTFPSQIKLGERCSAWVESEILAVNQARIAGKSEQDIKELITQLKNQRQQNCFQ